jgi:hypothetical protein
MMPRNSSAGFHIKAADLSQVRSWVLDRGYANFRELRQGEVRIILLLRGWVNDIVASPSAKTGAWHPSLLSLTMVAPLYT